MRDLNHPDVQRALEVLSNPQRVVTRNVWAIADQDHYHVSALASFRSIRFTREERDLIVAHLTILGAF